MNASTSHVVEVVLYRLREGVSRETQMAALQAAQSEIASLPGFIRREVLADADGQWVEMVYWRTMDEALNAMNLIADKPNLQQAFTLLDEGTIRMLHMLPVLTHAVAEMA